MKQPRAYLKAPLKHVFFHHFNDCIVVDHIVPHSEKRTPRGYRYMLTITDSWSNYVVAVPVRSQTAKENISAIMNNWVYKHGMCREIIVDNHPGFTSKFFSEVWSYFDCKKTHGTSYKSSSTARAEKSNKRINQALRACLPKGKEHHWDEYLGKVTFALNCLKNRRTGYSSHKMVYGRELNIPLSLIVHDGARYRPTDVDNSGSEVHELHKKLKTIIKKVRENANVDFMYAKRYHDRNLHGPYFKAGEYCYVLVQCPRHKYSIRFRGPLRINKVINDHLYLVQITPEKEKIINISKMKHYDITNKYAQKKIREMTTPIKVATGPTNHIRPQKTKHRSEDDSEDDMITVYHKPASSKTTRNLVQNSSDIQVSNKQSSVRGTQRRSPSPRISDEPDIQITSPESYEPLRESNENSNNVYDNDTDEELDRVLEEEAQEKQKQNLRSKRLGLRNSSLIKNPERYGNHTNISLVKSREKEQEKLHSCILGTHSCRIFHGYNNSN